MKQIIFLLVFLFIAFPSTGRAAYSFSSPPHLDRQKLPFGCGSCHVGFNFKSGGGLTGCTSCHGDTDNKGGGSQGAEVKNIEREFRKTFRHPTFDVRGVHSSKEVLPEIDPRAPRHADCVDCHDPHLVSSENKYAGIRGKRAGNTYTSITKESELCYRCHGESANLPGRYENKQVEFSTNNPSYHPVEGEGKNTAVVSLLRPFREKKTNAGDISTISCSDCHGSDSLSSPRGPHGSNNQFILVDNFSIRDNETESSFAYALCYRCHSRSSILGDESFKQHSLHIRGKGGGITAAGTSCHTCHDSHGSTENKYLIKFNPEVVSTNSAGLLKYVSKGVGSFRGECYLTCHGVNHNPKSY
ncbi:cytochrome c3 family protein [Geobacter sp. DSM 9736]|uniref:cytochrome c3 family protein n=1 Tax=Geobacter sp. DSM 9736 TaxID=1277350 RepID=UPI000B50039E|nr:cytochrome c3 family protein [Geobacter sp. DSM 9736]SNB45274.1 doubled CXXCH domain-containing protein [Geobacter sp. DSM 9736]